ncbi:MAG TPA: hypothetical protein VNK04_07355 [Gemmataceae bacterium]|nr:hypothetical protein [Gemmataceae bacterium]
MRAGLYAQKLLFPDSEVQPARVETTSTFGDNMRLPVHRWFRYSAGFSAQWAEAVIADAQRSGRVIVFDPFAGAATTLLAAERLGVECYGVEAHPFVSRIARAKLLYRSDPDAYLERAREVKRQAARLRGLGCEYPALIHKCFSPAALECLDHLRRAWQSLHDNTPASELVWLTLVAILRPVSHAGTAPWQYVLPRKAKKAPLEPAAAFDLMTRTFAADMWETRAVTGPRAVLVEGDARSCEGVPNGSVNLVVTSPPYANNYDYADATRLEMCFLREIDGWGDLQGAVRHRLIRSCSQHVPESAVNLDEVLAAPELAPIRSDLTRVCRQLDRVRRTKGGRKTYHLMVACYFLDMAQVWQALRRVCRRPSRACFVLGDSAPYGVYVPVMEWIGALAQAAGFDSFAFEKTRDRNVKWKNRKHRVPLCEGRLWVRG